MSIEGLSAGGQARWLQEQTRPPLEIEETLIEHINSFEKYKDDPREWIMKYLNMIRNDLSGISDDVYELKEDRNRVSRKDLARYFLDFGVFGTTLALAGVGYHTWQIQKDIFRIETSQDRGELLLEGTELANLKEEEQQGVTRTNILVVFTSILVSIKYMADNVSLPGKDRRLSKSVLLSTAIALGISIVVTSGITLAFLGTDSVSIVLLALGSVMFAFASVYSYITKKRDARRARDLVNRKIDTDTYYFRNLRNSQ